MSVANLVNLIRKEVLKTFKNEFNGFELATVVSPGPKPAIRVDNMKVEIPGDSVVVCEHLVKHAKIVSLNSIPDTLRDTGAGIEIDLNSIAKPGEFSLSNANISLSHVALDFEDVLKAGDRVLVQAIPGGQKYIIIDRVV